jgi:hypothetical protein
MTSQDFWKQLGRYLDISTEKSEEDKEKQVRVYLKCLSFGIIEEAKMQTAELELEKSSCKMLVQSVL